MQIIDSEIMTFF